MISTFVQGATTRTAALDIRSYLWATAKDVSDSQQWGITSFVFHPDWASGQTHMFVVLNQRPQPSAPVVSWLLRFTSYDNGLTFNPATARNVLALPQQTSTHHFGQIQVGPWNQLYLGSGDGAGSLPNTLAWRAQDWNSYYGAILQIDPYVDAPAVGNGLVILAKGFRNPWRFSFDRATNWLWVGDVGQDTWEEIDMVGPGGNYGWPYYEGPECTQVSCNPAYMQMPVHAFDHSEGAAAIGGYVYRGTDNPPLYGYYVFGSASHPRLWALKPDMTRIEIGSLPRGIPTSFFEDARGELYVIDTSFNGIWRLVPSSGSTGGVPIPTLLSRTGCVDPAQPRNWASGVIPYDVNHPLWSDGADKQRGFALPEGAQIVVRPNGDFDMPVRTVTLKSFYINGQPIETRLLMRHPLGGGWRGYSYEWNGNDAVLLDTGKVKTIGGVTWQYPSREQCSQCHTPAAGATLGLEMAQLNRDFTYPSTGRTYNQIDTFKVLGLFRNNVPWAAQWPALATRTSGTATDRARAYLHANCSFCHRPGGPGQGNMDLRYWIPTVDMNVCWQRPQLSDLGDPWAFLVAPNSPENSVVLLRMARRDSYGMPPLGTSQVDAGMLGTIDGWIREMPIACQ